MSYIQPTLQDRALVIRLLALGQAKKSHSNLAVFNALNDSYAQELDNLYVKIAEGKEKPEKYADKLEDLLSKQTEKKVEFSNYYKEQITMRVVFELPDDLLKKTNNAVKKDGTLKPIEDITKLTESLERLTGKKVSLKEGIQSFPEYIQKLAKEALSQTEVKDKENSVLVDYYTDPSNYQVTMLFFSNPKANKLGVFYGIMFDNTDKSGKERKPWKEADYQFEPVVTDEESIRKAVLKYGPSELKDIVNKKLFISEEVESNNEKIWETYDEYVNPDKIVVTLKNGRKLEISKKHIKGGQATYQLFLRAFDQTDSNPKAILFLNRALLQMVSSLEPKVNLEENSLDRDEEVRQNGGTLEALQLEDVEDVENELEKIRDEFGLVDSKSRYDEAADKFEEIYGINPLVLKKILSSKATLEESEELLTEAVSKWEPIVLDIVNLNPGSTIDEILTLLGMPKTGPSYSSAQASAVINLRKAVANGKLHREKKGKGFVYYKSKPGTLTSTPSVEKPIEKKPEVVKSPKVSKGNPKSVESMSDSAVLKELGVDDMPDVYKQAKRSTVYDVQKQMLSEDEWQMSKLRALVAAKQMEPKLSFSTTNSYVRDEMSEDDLASRRGEREYAMRSYNDYKIDIKLGGRKVTTFTASHDFTNYASKSLSPEKSEYVNGLGLDTKKINVNILKGLLSRVESLSENK